jgi:uncharacterized protein with ParB-like and HNH nuclease domain
MRTGLETQIKADTIKIGDLLGGDNRLAIPAYQRPFDWKKDEASDFLEDLRGAMDGKFDPFFGTIVIDISDNESFQIIDGQQRITTFNLLLIALRTIANKNGTREDVRLATKIHSVLSYENRTSGKSVDALSRLDPSISIREAYLPIVKNQDWNGKVYAGGNIKLKIRKIKPILDFFLEELSKFKHDEISQLLDTLYRGYVVILRITNKIQALEIFEHANVRGMELNAADLLKSYFISNIEDQKDTDLENRWIEIVSNSDNVIRMIKHFGWTMFNKKIVANRNVYYAELKKYGDKIGEKKLLDSFDQFAQAYGLVESGEIEDLVNWAQEHELTDIAKEQKAFTFIRSLKGIRLFRIAQTYPLIAAALVNYKSFPSNTSANALMELVDTLEKYHFINSYICQRRGNEVETLYAETSKVIMSSKNKLPEQVNDLKNKLKNQLADFKEFEPKFVDITYDTSAPVLKLIYYLFDRIENADRKGREVEQIFNPKMAIVKGDWEVEHILAQKPMSPHTMENVEDVINNIGSLLVVPSGTNKTVGNKEVKDKVAIFKEKIGKMSSVMQFCSAFESGALGKFSTKENVNTRAVMLAKEAYGKVFILSKEQSSVLS